MVRILPCGLLLDDVVIDWNFYLHIYRYHVGVYYCDLRSILFGQVWRVHGGCSVRRGLQLAGICHYWLVDEL